MKWLFIVCLLAFAHQAFAQQIIVVSGKKDYLRGSMEPVEQEVIDMAVMQAGYELKSVKDTSKTDKLTEDLFRLEVGKKASKFYSENARMRESILANVMKQGVPVNVNNLLKERGITSNGDDKTIYKFPQENKIRLTDKIFNTYYQYEEELSPMNWQISSDTMSILGYSCQKASTQFRGRDFEAWFTTDIPVNDGPWKFHGLPGLILKVADSKNHYVFQCVGIEQSNTAINYPKQSYVKGSRKGIEKMQQQFAINPFEFIKANADPSADINIKHINKDGVPVDPEEVKFPYNPIELE